MVSSSPYNKRAHIVSAERGELVGCGPTQQGVEVAIVDPETGDDVRPGSAGEIWVRGASVADGYFAPPETTAATFGAHRANGEGPYLRTGDLGFFRDGELFITGRLKDLIIVNGRNLHPQDVEQSAQQERPALITGRGAAFAVDRDAQEALVLVQELHRHAPADLSALITEIRAAILNDHEVHAGAILLVSPGTVTVTSSGKLARHAAREAFLAGRLAPLAAWYGPGWSESAPPAPGP
jgi:acyl-CoA synthetase (AMP-forming)/AMP-acid ligase II